MKKISAIKIKEKRKCQINKTGIQISNPDLSLQESPSFLQQHILARSAVRTGTTDQDN